MIRMSVGKMIGRERYTFSFEGASLYEVVAASQQADFGSVTECGVCGGHDLSLRAYETKEDKYQYVKICCTRCRAQATFGKTKKEGAFFLRRGEDGKILWEKPPAREEQAA